MKDGVARRKLDDLGQSISSFHHRLRHCEEMIAKQGEVRKQDGLAELEGRFFAYLDGYYHGREYLFDGELDIYDRDILLVFRQVLDLAVRRWYQIKELREEVDKFRAEARKP